MSADVSGPPPPVALLELATSFWRPRATAAAVRLGIPELLERGPRMIGELATSVGAPEENLYRLLRALARDRIFEEQAGRTFALTSLSRALLPGAPGSVRHVVLWLGSTWISRLWDKLDDAVLTGAGAFRDLYGADLYAYLKDHPAEGAVFHAAMEEMSVLSSELVASAVSFSRFELVADIGGGTGEQVAAILARHPGLRGVNFDAPEVEGKARETLARRGVADRCEVRSGDLRETLPQGADAYLLKNIVHDLSDHDAVSLLSRCLAAGRRGCAVIVVQNVVPEVEGPYLQFLDLQLLLTGAGGKERTLRQFEEMFSAADLRLTQVVETPAMLSVLVGEV